MRLAQRGYVRVRQALRWRPVFLAALALSNSAILASKAAKVPRCTAYRHRDLDSQFAAQWEAAEAYAIELLHAVTWKSAIEGECEPVYWQGIEVGHVKKVDNRLRIELLRAHLPAKFQTPGAKVQIGIHQDNRSVTIYTKEDQAVVQQRRVDALKKAKELEGGSLIDAKGLSLDQILKAGQTGVMP